MRAATLRKTFAAVPVHALQAAVAAEQRRKKQQKESASSSSKQVKRNIVLFMYINTRLSAYSDTFFVNCQNCPYKQSVTLSN